MKKYLLISLIFALFPIVSYGNDIKIDEKIVVDNFTGKEYTSFIYNNGDNYGFSYLVGDDYYINFNGKIFGPYKEIMNSYAGEDYGVYIVKKDGKNLSIINGVEGKIYDEIDWISNSLKLSDFYFTVINNGKAFYVKNGKESVQYDEKVMSYSGKDNKFIFIGLKNNNFYLNISEKEYGPFALESINSYLSQDKTQIAFKVNDTDTESWVESRSGGYIVYNGISHNKYKSINSDSIIFSQDGTKFAYIADDDNDNSFIVENGVEKYKDKYYNITNLKYSVDGKNLIFFGSKSNEDDTRSKYIVNNGVETKLNDMNFSNDDIYYSPDGFSYAYIGRKDGKEYMVSNGKTISGGYDDILNVSYSKNSKYLNYVGRKDGKYSLFVNGKEIYSDNEQIDIIMSGSSGGSPVYGYGTIYSEKNGFPDTKNIGVEIYTITKNDKYRFLINGFLSEELEEMPDIEFSKDGNDFAYVKDIDDGNKILVLNGIESKQKYKKIYGINFSDKDNAVYFSADTLDGKNILIKNNTELLNPNIADVDLNMSIANGLNNNLECIFSNNIELKCYDSIFKNGFYSFSFSGIGYQQGYSTSSIFSKDGKKYIILAKKDNKIILTTFDFSSVLNTSVDKIDTNIKFNNEINYKPDIEFNESNDKKHNTQLIISSKMLKILKKEKLILLIDNYIEKNKDFKKMNNIFNVIPTLKNTNNKEINYTLDYLKAKIYFKLQSNFYNIKKDNRFTIILPNTNPLTTTETNLRFEGEVPAGEVSKIIINGLELTKFVPHSTYWYYFANIFTGNLKDGLNIYKIEYYSANNELIYENNIVVTKK